MSYNVFTTTTCNCNINYTLNETNAEYPNSLLSTAIYFDTMLIHYFNIQTCLYVLSTLKINICLSNVEDLINDSINDRKIITTQ